MSLGVAQSMLSIHIVLKNQAEFDLETIAQGRANYAFIASNLSAQLTQAQQDAANGGDAATAQQSEAAIQQLLDNNKRLDTMAEQQQNIVSSKLKVFTTMCESDQKLVDDDIKTFKFA